MSNFEIDSIKALSSSDNILEAFDFDSEVFFYALLPPIIFESGYSLKRRMFFQNAGTILSFAFGGTIISTAVVGLALWAAGEQGWINGAFKTAEGDTSLVESLMFAALISAVDPVATLR